MLARGCAGKVKLVVNVCTVAVYPRHTVARWLIRQDFCERPGTDTVAPPVPLDKVARFIVPERSWDDEAAARGIDTYTACNGGRR